MFQIRCRKCRKLIVVDTSSETRIINSHGVALAEKPDNCSALAQEHLLFLNEECLPSWVVSKIEEVEWTKGRLNCPHCESRLGAFDYVSGSKCECNERFLPSVHIIKSKIDLVRINS